MKFLTLFSVGLLFIATTSMAQSGGTTSGGGVFCDTLNTGFISLTNYTGSIAKWQSKTASTPWVDIQNITSTQYYFHLKENTSYRALINKTGNLTDTSTISTVSVHPAGEAGSLVGGGTFCENSGSGNINLVGYSGNVLHWESSIDGGNSWTNIASTSKTLNYSNVNATSLFRCILNTYSVCPNDTAQPAQVAIDRSTLPGNLIGSDTICYKSADITLKLTGKRGRILEWNTSTDGTNWAKLSSLDTSYSIPQPDHSSFYYVLVQNGTCPALKTNIAVAGVFPVQHLSLNNDVILKRYEVTRLSASGNGVISWKPEDGLDNPHSFFPAASPFNSTLYHAILTDPNGCSSTDSVLVEITVPIPNAFTPNGDGTNDYFEIENINDFPNNTFKVIDRNGNLVYSAAPYQNNWNGKSSSGNDLTEGVYFFNYNPGNGEAMTTGSVLIKR